MCFVFIWEQTATCATYSINWLVFITEMKSVYSAVRTGSLNKAVWASSLKASTTVPYAGGRTELPSSSSLLQTWVAASKTGSPLQGRPHYNSSVTTVFVYNNHSIMATPRLSHIFFFLYLFQAELPVLLGVLEMTTIQKVVLSARWKHIGGLYL